MDVLGRIAVKKTVASPQRRNTNDYNGTQNHPNILKHGQWSTSKKYYECANLNSKYLNRYDEFLTGLQKLKCYPIVFFEVLNKEEVPYLSGVVFVTMGHLRDLWKLEELWEKKLMSGTVHKVMVNTTINSDNIKFY